jgi:chemotaxis protein methyltransferase CheR
MNETVSVTDEEVASLSQSILTRYGIDFTCYEPKSLKRRVVRLLLMNNFISIHELWIRLLRDQSFIHTFMNEISVGMTSMFRDPIFWKHLKRLLTKGFTDTSHFSIWHAGCSTGEEVYSLGIVLSETGLSQKTKAFASDINQDALEVARRGEYHKIRMIENEQNFKEYNPYVDFARYYAPIDGKNVKMDEGLIKHVTFKYHNLINDPFTEKHDLILCRNVMIYFDADAKQKLLRKFYDSLKPGGYLVIGFYDTMLSLIDQNLFTLADSDAKIFQKNEAI